jgi:hypothetical protein
MIFKNLLRFLNAEGRDVIPRKDRIWTTSGVASRMVEALKAANRPVRAISKISPKLNIKMN